MVVPHPDDDGIAGPHEWNALHPDVPPVGFLLRDMYEERWLRLRTIKPDVEYSQDARARRVTIDRCLAAADHTLGIGSPCSMIVQIPCSHHWQTDIAAAGLAAFDFKPLGRLPANLWDEDDGYFVEPICLFETRFAWRPNHAEGLLMALASATVEGLLVERQHGRAVAPYRGGVDVFFADQWERDNARDVFAEWASDRDDRL